MRKGITYIYTIGGDENISITMLSRTSPFGPYDFPRTL